MSRQGPDGETVKKSGVRGGGYTYPALKPVSADALFDWGEVDGKVLARAVACITSRGHAVSYALNRSGTCGCITILAGAERPKYYVESVDEAERVLNALCAD